MYRLDQKPEEVEEVTGRQNEGNRQKEQEEDKDDEEFDDIGSGDSDCSSDTEAHKK